MGCFIRLFLALRLLYFLFENKFRFDLHAKRSTLRTCFTLRGACPRLVIFDRIIRKILIIFYTSHENLLRKITIGNVCDVMSANAELISAITGILFLDGVRSHFCLVQVSIGIRFRCVYTINYDYYIILCPCNSILSKLVL